MTSLKTTRRVKAWAVVRIKPDIYWADLDVGFYAVHPSAHIAKVYAANSNVHPDYKYKVVPCTIEYQLPITSTKK